MVYRMTEWIECTLDKLGEIVGGATPSTNVKTTTEAVFRG